MDNLYEAIGGLPALEVAIERFCDRVRADRQVAPFFASMDLQRQKSHLIAFLGEVVGGPMRYSGASMRRAHAHVRIEQRHFDAVAGHLAATLAELGIGEEIVAAVMDGVWPLAGQIVNTRTAGVAA